MSYKLGIIGSRVFTSRARQVWNKKIMKHFVLFINHYSSKLQAWSWQKLWYNRQKGIGYRNGLKG